VVSASFRRTLFGYARVSTVDQNPDHQIDALLRAGVDRADIHVDTASGAKASRPELDIVLKMLRKGDTLKVTRLDRLSRSVLHLVTLGAELRGRGIGLHVIEQGIDADTMEGRAMFGMLSVLAELQRELIVANTNDGLAAARARGRVDGRRPRLRAEQAALAQELYDARETTVRQIADLFGVPRSTPPALARHWWSGQGSIGQGPLGGQSCEQTRPATLNHTHHPRHLSGSAHRLEVRNHSSCGQASARRRNRSMVSKVGCGLFTLTFSLHLRVAETVWLP